MANCHTAVDQGLTVLPVLNKIDLPAAEPERVRREIEEIIGIDARDAVAVSAKLGTGIPELLHMLVRRIPQIMALATLFGLDPTFRYVLDALLFGCGIAVMIAFLRSAQRVEPFIARG